MMPYYDCGGNLANGSYGGVGALLMILFWVVIVGLVIVLLRGLWWSGNKMHRRDIFESMRGEKDHLDILKERYAKGEIDKAEFEQKKKDLMS